ncbi:4Fe-4S binding protein [Halomonas urumqiensis]|uniref:4Fe-4S ferredoxin n=1 Tax=Halomonas urumqiensis TaxID=1684789 RepID=A0A2N7UEL8_9GAMM|nr:4Fe-4S binding protein [Halomonas urumqiensis]PMR78894.1 4Fe-4S ferredoxin [Halomonas urumqiensis]PTB04199.1 4Fe-4S dicluster domain-containing protein [Halomonas urumqiensis]GHE19527.1 formate hydrogenlyase subunit 6 [Halomonas urumqiensis]
MNQPIDTMSVDESVNRQARESMRRQVSWPLNLTPSHVEYTSQGHALLIGNEVDVRHAAQQLLKLGLPSQTLLFTKPVDAEDAVVADAVLAETQHLACHALDHESVSRLSIAGYLGAFRVQLDQPGGSVNLARALANRDHFDQILDLGNTPSLALELPPPGYLAVLASAPDLATRLEDFAGLVGEFDKPRYFQINHELCAHSSSGNTGCTRCLAVCPADAIQSHQGRVQSRIEIDPYRCHGVGSCSSACPTGAISFRLPETQRQQDTLLAWLDAYRQAAGTLPVIRFATSEYLDGDSAPAGHVIDIPLEELGSAGHDQWLTALAGGAAEVRIQRHHDMPEILQAFIDAELSQAHALLAALGHDTRRVQWLEVGDTDARDALPTQLPLASIGGSLEGTSKRQRLNQVLDHLAEQGRQDGQRHALPASAAHGDIAVDTQRCTLCMACVGNCPTPALKAGEDSPQLSFLEADCVQCGLCAEACPEDAITLHPGFLAAPSRHHREVRHAEAAFDCIRCGKPFATQSTIASIKTKLADHPYFSGEAMSRLEMCEDCRVKDVWREMARDPEAQLKV